ncbi:DUF4337 domain-containing protein [uncultured Aquitalea sp.]|uniref:DUF4337 domain-containing protein n=1 Tax=uncultured Aquitalea sp. TaxID=540272 RepID=UPI0025F7A216|nr:DUF4337 domain-containing protein [uncultured Aquitalea sp.]
MAEEEYEISGMHEKMLEEEAERSQIAQKIALLTAILATIGAIFSYQSGATQNEALFLKNQGILKQSEASDAWAYYQAKSTKAHIDQMALAIVTDPAKREAFAADLAKEEKQRAELQKQAQALQAEARRLNEESERVLRPHERMALAMTLIQIAVALASITALTRKHWLLTGSVGSALAGIGIAISTWL